MIEKIDSNLIRELLEKSASQQADSPKPPATSQADASLDVNYASLLENAAQPPETDAQAVRQAQELLASGQLDTPENIRAAAENIVNYGI